MKGNIRNRDRMSAIVIGCAFFTAGFFFALLGLTLLPAIGIIVATPLIRISLYFFGPALQAISSSEEAVRDRDEEASRCPPPIDQYDETTRYPWPISSQRAA
jgi:hypothetical protein